MEIDQKEFEQRIIKIINLKNDGMNVISSAPENVASSTPENVASSTLEGHDDMDKMMYPFFVLEDYVAVENSDKSITDTKEIVGYAYATKFRDRAAYDQTVELSIYLDKDHVGKGYGRILYNAVIDHITKKGFKVALAGISSPNPASFRFHEKLGFEKVAELKSVGYKFGNYIDVLFYQKILN